MNKIEQILVCGHGHFFKKGIQEKWGLKDYYDENLPCVFWGTADIIDQINSHKGFKVIYPINDYDNIGLQHINYSDNLVVADHTFLKVPKHFKRKRTEIEIKDYSLFKPTTLGENIYCYFGTHNRLHEFQYDKIMEIQKKIPFDIIFDIKNDVKDYQDMNYIKENYYDKCFLNINLSKNSGLTSARELGLMGIRTIMNLENYQYPFMISYRTDDDIIGIIHEESKKIGTIQKSIDPHTAGDNWLNVNFWLDCIEPMSNLTGYMEMRNDCNTQGLLDLINYLPYDIEMAEIGCYIGESTKMFLDSGKISKLYAIDIWEDATGFYGNFMSGHDFKSVESIFDNNLKGCNIEKMKMDINQAAPMLPKLDFIYIDANHEYEYVKNDIKVALTKIKKGGIIAGHDYLHDTPGVIRAVDEIFGKPDIVFSDYSWLINIK